MRTIKTMQDIRILREANVFSNGFMNFLEEEFLGLKEAFDFDGLDEAFTLDVYGYIVVCEKGDNLRDLSVVGLDREAEGLLGSFPEFVDKVERQGEHWFKVVCVLTNEFSIAYYVSMEVVADDIKILIWLSWLAGKVE